MTKEQHCRVCGQKVKCEQGHEVIEYEQDKEFNDYFYSCSTCIQLGTCSTLGSIVHHCSNPITNGALSSVTNENIKKIFLEIRDVKNQ